jgi:hypothetical protein
MTRQRVIFALILILFVSIPINTIQKYVKADSLGDPFELTINSPTNQTYGKTLTLEVTFLETVGAQFTLTFGFDGKNLGSIPVQPTGELHDVYPVIGNVQLTKLTEGTHNVTVCLDVEPNDRKYYDSVIFTVDIAPVISNISVENRTYNETDIPLSFVISKPASTMTYSLDGHRNTTITGNTTLTRLSAGTHNINIYAWDPAGTVGSQTANFTVAKQTQPQQQTPFFIIVVVSLTSSIILIAIGLLFWKKRRHRLSFLLRST